MAESHHPSPLINTRTSPPTAKAKGKMKADMARAVFVPRSLAIMKTLAMQGMKRVMVTMAVTSWTVSAAVARQVESPVAP